MRKFLVRAEQTFSEKYVVEAESPEDAINKLSDALMNGEVPDPVDLNDTNYEVFDFDEDHPEIKLRGVDL